MGLAEAVLGAVGQPASVRVGIVESTAPLVVTAQGVPFDDVGYLGGYAPTVGDNVALLGQCSEVGSDPASWLVLGAIRSAPLPIATLRQLDDQPILTDVPTAVIFDTVYIDTAGGWDPATPTRWTAPVSGYYQVSGGVSFSTNSAGGRQAFMRVSGSDHPGSSVSQPGSAAIGARMAMRTMQVILVAGDYIEFWVIQDSGGTINLSVAGTTESTMEVRQIP